MITDSDTRASKINLTVPPDAKGARLDVFIANAIGDLSRSRAKALIKSGHVAVGGATVVEPKRAVKSDDWIVVALPPAAPAKPKAEPIPLTVVFEDEEVIVVDKPAGMVVHPAPGHATGTLVNALLAHCGDSLSGIGGIRRPGIVHRLDKDTTGLLVVAKTDRAHRALAAQFAQRGRDGDLARQYKALVWGAPTPATGRIDAEIGRSSSNRQKMAVTPGRGRTAITDYRVAETFGPPSEPIASLLSLRLQTGRTHQIRVHLARIGHPVIGDKTYGAGMATKAATLPEPTGMLVRRLSSQVLHAEMLSFRHPTSRELVQLGSSLPNDFNELLISLRSMGNGRITRF